jgi:hypothetical protein
MTLRESTLTKLHLILKEKLWLHQTSGENSTEE